MKVNFEWNFEGILICSFTTIDTIDSMTNLGRENEEREFKESTTEVEKGMISLQRGNSDPYRHEGISELYAGRYIGFHGIAQIVHRQNGTEATLQKAGGKDRFQKERGMDRPLRRMIPDERGLGGRHTPLLQVSISKVLPLEPTLPFLTIILLSI